MYDINHEIINSWMYWIQMQAQNHRVGVVDREKG